MSIDKTQLENVQNAFKDGESIILARCPACAEEGGDDTGNHLIIFPDGRFGCVVNPKEDPDSGEHRKRIMELVGIKGPARKLAAKSRFKPRVKMLTIQKQETVFPLKKRSLPGTDAP